MMREVLMEQLSQKQEIAKNLLRVMEMNGMCGCGCGGSDADEETREAPQTGGGTMVPCKYCGALFVQSATFCPNCGAKRTA